MQRRITWVGFGIDGALTKTVLHFFGCSGGVSAPYPAQVVVTKFRDGKPEAVALDGARLNTPDGVKLDVAFPEDGQPASALCGVAVEITAQQARENLADSRCVVEFQTRGAFTRYRPIEFTGDRETSTALLIKDHLTISSIVLVNPTEDIQAIPFVYQTDDAELPMGEETIPAWSVVELAIPDAWYAARSHRLAAPGGLIHAVPVAGKKKSPVCGYVVYRDAAVRRATSICAL